MTIYYFLYKKTHRTTGLQYLGQTVQDPFKYKGSGTVWKRHIKKHGDDVHTEVLGIFTTKQELADAGLYYSVLWNIVEDRQWANLRYEVGEGGFRGLVLSEESEQKRLEKQRLAWTTEEYRQKKSLISKRAQSSPEYRMKKSEHGKKVWESPELRQQASDNAKRYWRTAEGRQLASQRARNMWNDPEQKATILANRENADYKKKVSDSIKKQWQTPEYRAKRAKYYETRPVLICPFCNKQSKNSSAMTRWHFNNCKQYS